MRSENTTTQSCSLQSGVSLEGPRRWGDFDLNHADFSKVMLGGNDIFALRSKEIRTSVVVQWLRLCFPVKGVQV